MIIFHNLSVSGNEQSLNESKFHIEVLLCRCTECHINRNKIFFLIFIFDLALSMLIASFYLFLQEVT